MVCPGEPRAEMDENRTIRPYLLVDHVRDAVSHHVERPVQVDANHGVPLFLAHVEDHAVAEDAGGVDQDVEPTELFDCSADDPGRRTELRDGVVDCDSPASILLDLADDKVGGCCGGLRAVNTATEVVDDD